MSLPTRTCAARVLCKMTGLPLPPTMQHFCLHCGHQKHAPCGHQFDELRMNEEEYKDILDVIAPKTRDKHGKERGDRPDPKPAGKKGPSLEICFYCVSNILSSTTPAPAPAPTPAETPATTNTTNSSVQPAVRSSVSSNAADVLAAAAPLPSSTASTAKKSNRGSVVDLTSDAPKQKKTKQTLLTPFSGSNRQQKPKTKKQRKAYQLQRRLEILEYSAQCTGS